MNGQLGISALLHALVGDDTSVEAVRAAIGKTIAALAIDDAANDGDGALVIIFTDRSGLVLMDKGRSCCESRYLQTDDDLAYHVGAQLVGVTIADGPTVEEEFGDAHETAFLQVTTSLGTFTVVTHNEHNGYYGGFWLVAEARAAAGDA